MKTAPKPLPQSWIDKVRRGVEAVAYGNPLYQKILSAGVTSPDRLTFTIPDRWPGDAAAGRALMSTQGALFNRVQPPRQAVAFRNLRAVGNDSARTQVISIIDVWLERYNQWHEIEWSPDIMGERIGAWVGFYEFYAPAASDRTIARLTESLHRQYKHLVRTVTPSLRGTGGLRAIKGLILGALNFDESDQALGLACELLNRLLTVEILPDGGVISRSPSAQLHMARHLIDLRAIFLAAGIEIPTILNTTINAMMPALKLFRHGDGGLALFHGSNEETALLIDAVITQSETKSRVVRRLEATGYERLTAGRSLLIADCSAPPPRDYDATAHAGLLSFEFGQGRERIIVNCGGIESATNEWRTACAATAAHSTLTIEETNACEVLEAGGIVSAARVTAHRFEQNEMHCLDLSHDAYVPLFGLTFQRQLRLNVEGDELNAVDILSGSPGRHFALRWHLHPLIDVALTHSDHAALLRTSSGSGWRLRTEGHLLQLEHSVYCGSGLPRRSLQLKISGITGTPTTKIIWSLVREKKD